jgi:hypothetical protein
MSRPLRHLSFVLGVLLQFGCGDEGPNQGLTYADLEGTWVLLSLVYVSDANSSTTFDFRAAGGSGSIRFEADTTFLLVLVPNPGSPSQTAVGPVTLEGSTVSLTDNDDPDSPALSGTVVGRRLRLDTDNAEHDFNGDGADEPARVTVVFER